MIASYFQPVVHKYFFLVLLVILPVTVMSQNTTRPLTELINTTYPAWVLVKGWIDSAKNPVEVLPCNTARSKEALYQAQVTTRSPMGAIVFNTGGILVDSGWIRILGSGSARLNRTLPGWNMGKTIARLGDAPDYLLVADDAIGGFFALNGGGLGTDKGKIYYMAPGNLEWEPLDLTYTEFLLFCFNNKLDEFYKGQRWKNWRREVARLDGNMMYNFVPPLWSRQGKDINKNMRKAVPVEEQYTFNLYMRSQLGLDKKNK
jgi:hypothetical protein